MKYTQEFYNIFRIPEPIRKTVFCQAIKNGEVDDFRYLWRQFNKNKDRRFNEAVLFGLGCFNQDSFLET